MAEEKTRVDFNAPASLVERADRVADVLDISRTRLLIDALEAELRDLSNDAAFRRRLSDAYYAGRIDFETVFAGLADADWSGTATLEVGTEDYDTIALGRDHVEELLAAG